MKAVGQILKEAREIKLYSLEEVEKHIKIRKELLEALEQDNYDKLPPPTFIQGFIKNYGNFLNLDTKKLLAIFRRDFESHKHPPLVLESFARPMKNPRFNITPSKIFSGAVIAIVISFFIYLWIEYRQFVGAPPLQIDSPKDQQTVENLQVVVEGKTDPEVKIKVNEQDVGVDMNGRFSEEIKLSASLNRIIISATSKFGRTTKVERTVFVKK